MVIAGLCAATSVVFGAIYMMAAGAPHTYVVVNVAALVVGVASALLLRRVRARDHGIAEASTIAIGLVLVATAVFGVHIDGASRWVRVAGISLQPSLILLPSAILFFVRNRGWLSSIGLGVAASGLAMQPDRAIAGTLAAGLAALCLYRRELPGMVGLAAAIFGFASTMETDDVVAPVAFVEQVVQSAFAFHALTGVAVIAGLATILAPAAAGLRRRHEPEVFAVFGATWLAVITFAIVGNYPTPLVGYGSSAILGYCLSAAILPGSS